MFCKNCGVALNTSQSVCIKCGVKVGNGANYCDYCGKPVNPGADICLNCGVSLKKNRPESTSALNGQDKNIMIIIAILIGGWGIHNFMMDEPKRGIFRIIMTFCCGIGYIFGWIDAIKIATDNYIADPEKII